MMERCCGVCKWIEIPLGCTTLGHCNYIVPKWVDTRDEDGDINYRVSLSDGTDCPCFSAKET